MTNRPIVTASCVERDAVLHVTQWLCEDRTLYCQQHQSPEPWNVYTQQRTFCTVTLHDGTRPLDVGTSSHAAAVAAFVQQHWAGQDKPVVVAEYKA